MTINACANPARLTFPQQQNANSICNPNSPEAIVKKLLESLQQKSAPACSGSSPVCSGGSSANTNTDDENLNDLLKKLIGQMGATQQQKSCSHQPQPSACGAQPCAS